MKPSQEVVELLQRAHCSTALIDDLLELADELVEGESGLSASTELDRPIFFALYQIWLKLLMSLVNTSRFIFSMDEAQLVTTYLDTVHIHYTDNILSYANREQRGCITSLFALTDLFKQYAVLTHQYADLSARRMRATTALVSDASAGRSVVPVLNMVVSLAAISSANRNAQEASDASAFWTLGLSNVLTCVYGVYQVCQLKSKKRTASSLILSANAVQSRRRIIERDIAHRVMTLRLEDPVKSLAQEGSTCP